MLFILLMFSSCSLVLEISIQRENVTQKVRLQGPSYAGVYIQGRRGVKFSFSEKAKKIEKNLLLVLTLLSKNSCFGKTSGRFFFLILWPSHNVLTLFALPYLAEIYQTFPLKRHSILDVPPNFSVLSPALTLTRLACHVALSPSFHCCYGQFFLTCGTLS